ncbi:MAG: tRNA/rRNA methyltransferase [Bacteroidales bacterium]|jgi:tRNA/rRNA methyltransferase|nr:tRNA/rRNA methyltransferase [Bacteroidales bacterium]NLM92646.1 tRNA/rRNA methyltransferase [Bacteroidales bacterium]
MAEIVFILVSPAREENIGASARALKTMGFERLRLVSPQCDHLGARARATAHGSNDILEQAEVFSSLEEAGADLSLLIGSAAKKRNVAEDFHRVEDLPGIIIQKGELVQLAGIVFGREESGLTNEELALCDLLSTIPMKRKYPSLNLGQAVMVYATYLSKLSLDYARRKVRMAGVNELRVVREKAAQVLEDVGMDPGGNIYPRIMERLMIMNKDDLNLFHSFCKFYLKKYHNRLK